MSKKQEYQPKNRTDIPEEIRKVLVTKIIEIPWRGMTIIYFFRVLRHMPRSTQAVTGKYHNIIISQDRSFPEKSPLEYHMANPLRKNWFPKWYHIPSKSELSGIKTPIRKESRYEVCIKWLRHECHESLPSTTIEECIMENSDFWFLSLHAKRILNFERKTIEFEEIKK